MSINHRLSVMYVELYNDFKNKGITHIPNISVAKIVMIQLYNQFVKEQAIKPIEELSIEEKQGLVTECREVKNENYTNETLTTQCRILHLIRSINNYS